MDGTGAVSGVWFSHMLGVVTVFVDMLDMPPDAK